MKACRSRAGELAGFLLSLLPGWGRARRSDRVVWSLREVSPVTVTVCSCRDISTHPRAVIALWFHPSFLRRHQTCLPSLKRQTACEHQAVRHKLAANKCRLAVQMTQEPAHLAETSSLPNSHSSLKDEGGPLKKKGKCHGFTVLSATPGGTHERVAWAMVRAKTLPPALNLLTRDKPALRAAT